MADLMQFDLVSPERSLASLEVTQVQIPGADGDMTAMANHAPLITTLRPGLLTVSGPQGETKYVGTGGFAQIGAEGTTVLAERAVNAAEITEEVYHDMVRSAHAAHQQAHAANAGDAVDDAAKLLADMVAIGGHIGLTPPNL